MSRSSLINIRKVHNRFMDGSDKKKGSFQSENRLAMLGGQVVLVFPCQLGSGWRGHSREKIDWRCGGAGSVSLPMLAGEVVEKGFDCEQRVNIKKGYFKLFGQRKNRMAMWEVQKEVEFFTLPKKFYK